MENVVVLALLATLGTWALTALGAATVFCFRNPNPKTLNLMLGFASGAMIAASFWSLLQPAIERAEATLALPSWLVVSLGFLSGAIFMWLSDKIVTRVRRESACQNKKRTNRILLLVLSITLHNIPEGLAVGFAFGAAAISGEPSAYFAALGLAIGMSIQNFPEGAAIALPMRTATGSKHRAFLYGMGSGAIEPIAATLGFFLSTELTTLQPWFLGFAAGAMIFVVAEDLIPDSNINEYPHTGTWGVMAGFVIMMVLDVALG